MRTLKKSMLVLGSAVALGSIAIAAAPSPSHAASPCTATANPCAASPCAANPCAAAKPKFSRYGKQ